MSLSVGVQNILFLSIGCLYVKIITTQPIHQNRKKKRKEEKEMKQ
jgi:hypothetical protein